MKFSVVMLTYNEEPNLRRTLNSLDFMDEVLIIDSFSEDNTISIANQFKNTKVIQRKFDNHTNQWNFGLENASTNWILSIDADYVIPSKLKKELISLNLNSENIIAYKIPFKYLVFGNPLFSTILPPRLALFDKRYCRYIQDGHTQKLKPNGSVGKITNSIDHDDRKKLSRWIWAQERYADLEIVKLSGKEDNNNNFADKIRKTKFLAPFIVFLYTYFFRGNILSGKRGLYYSLQRMYAELIITLKLIEKDFEKIN